MKAYPINISKAFSHAMMVSLLLALSIAGCKKTNPWMVYDARNLPKPSGAPKVTHIKDIGTVRVLEGKPVEPGASDGVFVPGELAVIRGKNFGRMPSVAFGKKAVDVLARLEDGGIVVRFPLGLESGEISMSVNTPKGSGTKKIISKRFALASIVGMEDTVLLEITTTGVKDTKQKLKTGKVSDIAFHRYGAQAYLGSPTGEITVVDFSAEQTPKILEKKSSSQGKLVGMAAPYDADRLLTVVNDVMTIWDTSLPKNPSPWRSIKLPPNASKNNIIDVAVTPDGNTAVLLLAKINGVILADITDPRNVRWFDPVVVHVGDDNPLLVRRLEFIRKESIPAVKAQGAGGGGGASGTQELWVLSGDNSDSLKIGTHPLSAIQYDVVSARTGADAPSALKTNEFSLSEAGPPLDWTHTMNPQQIQAGTSLREDPSKMSFFIVTADIGLFDLPTPLDTPNGHQTAVDLLEKNPQLSKLMEVDSKGKKHPMKDIPKGLVLESTSVTTDGKVLASIGCQVKTDKEKEDTKVNLSCGVFSKQIGQVKVEFEPMTNPDVNILKPPFDFGRILIQP